MYRAIDLAFHETSIALVLTLPRASAAANDLSE
jgi:hypothetical protein